MAALEEHCALVRLLFLRFGSDPVDSDLICDGHAANSLICNRCKAIAKQCEAVWAAPPEPYIGMSKSGAIGLQMVAWAFLISGFARPELAAQEIKNSACLEC